MSERLTADDEREARYLAQQSPGDTVGVSLTLALAEIDALRSALAAKEAQLAEAHGYLSRLFTTCAPQCRPSEDLMTVCTQIDNYIYGCHAKRDALRAEVERLTRAVTHDEDRDADFAALEAERDAALARAERAEQGQTWQPLSTAEQLDVMHGGKTILIGWWVPNLGEWCEDVCHWNAVLHAWTWDNKTRITWEAWWQHVPAPPREDGPHS